jgi:hypothetical protein
MPETATTETSEPTVSLPGTHATESENSRTFLTDDDIKDFAVRIALSGLSLEDGIVQFDQVRTLRLEAAEEEYEVQVARFQKLIEDLEERILEEKNRLDALIDRDRLLREERLDLRLRNQLLELKKVTTLVTMRVTRLEKERQFFTEEEQKLEEKHRKVQEAIEGWRERELADAKKLHEMLLEISSTDQEELKRRATVLEEEKARTENSLKFVENKVEDLRAVGITRTIAGFLLWVGYTAFAGVGSVIGNLLQRRQPDPRAADIFGNFVRGFASFFGLQQGKSFLWLPLIKMLLFIGVLLIVVMGTTAIADLILRKFDSRWEKRPSQQSRGRARYRSQSRLQGLFSLFTTGADRFSLFSSNISRTDYVQLLASSPYLVLAAMGVFVLAALGLTEAFGAPNQVNTSATLTTASIGAIFTLVGTSCCLLYATKIVEPRWNRFIKEDQNLVGFWNYLRVNWEFALIILVMVGALLIVTLAPLGEPNDYRAWGFVALFMTMGSAGLAYGLIYRGIFRDYDVLYRRRQEYLTKVQEYALKPTLSDVFESTEPEELNKNLIKYRKAIDYLDALRIGSELNALEGNEPRSTSDFLNLWLDDLADDVAADESLLDIPNRYVKRLTKLIRRLGERRRPVDNAPLGLWEISPTERAAYESHNQQINANATRLEEIEREVQKLADQKREITSMLTTLRSSLRECENQKSAAKTELITKREEYEIQKKRHSATFTEAFLTGRILYRYLMRESEFQT